MSIKLRAACLQMNSGPTVDANLASINALSESLKCVDILVLPENFAQMPRREKERHIELEGEGKVQDFVRELAMQTQTYIVAGSIPIHSAEHAKPFARCLLVDANGSVDYYDKLHLFDVDLNDDNAVSGQQSYRESNAYRYGEQPATVKKAKVGQNDVLVGPSICYDLRFPELYRLYGEQNAEILTVPSAFTAKTGAAHWKPLLQARAIENQAFVLAAGQYGEHANRRTTWGHSMIIDSWGSVLAEKADGTGLIYADLHLDSLQETRSQMPALKHRRIR